LQINKTDFKGVYIYSCCHANGTYISLTNKKPKFVLTSLLPFLTTEGSRVLEKKVNETQVSKTVFSHLKERLLKGIFRVD